MHTLNAYLDHASANSDLKQMYQLKLKDSIKNLDKPLYKLCADVNVSHDNLSLFLKGDLSRLSL